MAGFTHTELFPNPLPVQVEIEQRVHHQGRVMKREHAKSRAVGWLAAVGMGALVQQLADEKDGLSQALGEMEARYEGERRTREAAEHCVVLIKTQAEEAAKVRRMGHGGVGGV